MNPLGEFTIWLKDQSWYKKLKELYIWGRKWENRVVRGSVVSDLIELSKQESALMNLAEFLMMHY